MSYLATLGLSLALCFSAQSLLLKLSGGRFTKNESNFYSSIGRIQAGATGDPEIMFLGSSLTGRLPDRADGFKGVANMGCDGGSAIDALRAMNAGILPAAPLIIVEVNTMERALDPAPSAIAAAMRRPWFRVGLEIPQLSAYARPSGFFYSLLLSAKVGSFDSGSVSDGLGIDSRPSQIPMPPRNWGDSEQALIEEIDGIVANLRTRGSEVVFVWLPPGRGEGRQPNAWKLALPARSGALWWDIGQEADPRLIQVTDGAHMAAPSAARTVVSVVRGLAPVGNSPE